jgi:hypothetical protein
MKSHEVKEVAIKLMINGSNPGTQMFVHDGLKIAKDIFAKVSVKYVYELCYSFGFVIGGRLRARMKLCYPSLIYKGTAW